jgi:hypothetical protein
MANSAEFVPPIAAIVAITAMEKFFPGKHIDDELGAFEQSFRNPADSTKMKSMAGDLARGWQVTVDLVYSILAVMTLLISRVLLKDIYAASPVFWIMMVTLFLNVMFLVACANAGPERVAAVRIPLPFGFWPTLRHIAISFVIISNAAIVGGVFYEMWAFSSVA